jgi:hypothetical protein
VTGMGRGVKRRRSRLSVTLKRSEVQGDERVLEEQVKSSFSNLLQRHAQWKSPTSLKVVKEGELFDLLDIYFISRCIISQDANR